MSTARASKRSASRSPAEKRSIRRSVVLPAELLREARQLGGEDLASNVNRLVKAALVEFVEQRRREAFALEMARMAQDSQIQSASCEIQKAFRRTESDGLG